MVIKSKEAQIKNKRSLDSDMTNIGAMGLKRCGCGAVMVKTVEMAKFNYDGSNPEYYQCCGCGKKGRI